MKINRHMSEIRLQQLVRPPSGVTPYVVLLCTYLGSYMASVMYLYIGVDGMSYPIAYLGLFSFVLIYGWSQLRGKRQVLACVLVACLGASLGYVRTSSEIRAYEELYPFYLHAPGVYSGQIVSRVENHSFIMTVDTIQPDKEIDHKTIQGRGKIRVYLGEDVSVVSSLRRYDEISLRGTVQGLTYDQNAGAMDMRSRYMSEGMVGHVYDAHEVHHRVGNMNRWQYFLHLMDAVHEQLEKLMDAYLSETMSPIGRGLVLGGNYTAMDEEVVASFATTGLIHILSVSGSHMALLFLLVRQGGKLIGCKERTALVVGGMVVLIYATLVGWNPPVLRSVIMGSLGALAMVKHRKCRALEGLLVTTSWMLLYEPLMLFDVSFQLSLLSTGGIILWSRGLYELGIKNFIGKVISLTLAAQLFTWPLCLYYFHRVSIGLFLSAIFVAPILELIIMVEVGLLLLQWILWEPILQGMWLLVDYGLRLAMYLNQGIAHLWSSYLPSMSYVMTICYAVLLVCLYYYMEESELISYQIQRCLLVGLMAVSVISVWGHHIYVQPIALRGGGTAFLAIHESLGESFLYIDLAGKPLTKGIQKQLEQAIHREGLASVTQLYHTDRNKEQTAYHHEPIAQKDKQITSKAEQIAEQNKQTTSKDKQTTSKAEQIANQHELSWVTIDGKTCLITGKSRKFLFTSRSTKENTRRNIHHREQESHPIDTIIFGTNDEQHLTSYRDEWGNLQSPVYLWMNRTVRHEIDSEEEGLYVVGSKRIGRIML